MQVTMLRPAARRSDVISMAIGLMLGAVTGFIYYLKAHDGFTAALVFVLGGLLAGFGVAMMMPSQRQYRKAEKLRQQLRKP